MGEVGRGRAEEHSVARRLRMRVSQRSEVLRRSRKGSRLIAGTPRQFREVGVRRRQRLIQKMKKAMVLPEADAEGNRQR
jgi:hypothetical protein